MRSVGDYNVDRREVYPPQGEQLTRTNDPICGEQSVPKALSYERGKTDFPL